MILDRFRVDDRVAVVTGAGRGIGAASAVALAEAGADVLLSARSADQLEEVARAVKAAGRRAYVVPADLMDLEAVADLADQAFEEFGRLDIVVNNVGGTIPNALLDTDAAYLEEAFHFNVSTAHALTRSAVPQMLKNDGGSVVNISSVVGRVAGRGYLAYGTAKAALAHYTRLAAQDLSPTIRVNAIAVGSVMTSALEFVASDEATMNEMTTKTPLGPGGRGGGHLRGSALPEQPGRRVRHRQGARGGRWPADPQPRPPVAGPRGRRGKLSAGGATPTKRVVAWSTGTVGRHAIAGIDARPDLELVGVWVSSEEKVGKDAGELAGLGRELGVAATNDKEALFALEPDCIVHTAMVDDRIFEAIADLTEMVERGINVVSSGPVLLCYPEALGLDEFVDAINDAGARSGASLHVNGIDPGWANDVLPLALSSLSQRIDLVRVSEIADYSTYYQPVVVKDVYGFGKPMDEVADAVAARHPLRPRRPRRTPDRCRGRPDPRPRASRRSSSVCPPSVTSRRSARTSPRAPWAPCGSRSSARCTGSRA